MNYTPISSATCIYCGRTDGMLCAIATAGLFYQHIHPLCPENKERCYPDGTKERVSEEAQGDLNGHIA